MNEQIYNNYIEEVGRRADAAASVYQSAESCGYGYLQGVLFHMFCSVPGVEEYLKVELERLTELNNLERV